MIGEALKLSVYFGDAVTTGSDLASDALMAYFARRDVRVAALLRGVEGFGINRRIHAGRFPDISTDLPLLGVAVDERPRIESMRDDVDRIIPRGLVTLEHAVLASADDVAEARFPTAPGRSAKLTIYCSRGERVNGRPAFRDAVDVLRRHGATGAIVLLGVDGVLRGRRRKARLLTANPDTPMMIISVGSAAILQRALPALRERLDDPLVTLESITQVKHDGELLEPLPVVVGDDEEDVWHTLRIYTRQSAQVNGRALHSELTHRLREVGAAGVTTIIGEWGFSSDERPHGDRFGRLASDAPSYTVYIDRPRKVAEVWPIVDDITAEHGIVTWLVVPGYRERAGDAVHGHLHVADRPARAGAQPARPSDADLDVEGGEDWVGRLAAQAEAFARTRGLQQPIVRVTLVDGEQFFLASLQPEPGDGFITLHPHPARYADMVGGGGGDMVTPRALIIPIRSVVKIELLTRPPRGTRSLVGFRPRPEPPSS